MHKLIVFTLFLLFIPVELFATEYDNKAVITHKGKKGVFIDEDTYRAMITDLQEFQILKAKKVPELENKVKALEYQIRILEKELEVTESIAQKWKANYLLEYDLRIQETNRLQEQLNKKNIWYKSPAFMFSVGLIGGGLLSVGIAWGFNNATDQGLWNI